jgi:hypothetical protein
MCRLYDFFIQPMQSTIQDPEALHKHPLITPEWVGPDYGRFARHSGRMLSLTC